MHLKGLIIIIFLLFCSSQSFAVSPEIRLPEWYKTEFKVADWLPEQNLLVVKSVIYAPLVDLHQVSCSLQHNFLKILPESSKSHKLVKKGDKAVFIFRLNVKPEYKGWLNFDLRALPNQQGLLQILKNNSAKPITNALLESEVEKLQKPILLGQSIPVFIAEDIVVTVPPEIVLRPFQIRNESFYLWLPEERFGTGMVAETFKGLKKSTKANQFRSAAAACSLLINKLKSTKASLRTESPHQEVFEIPNSIAINLLELNHATFYFLEKQENNNLQLLIDKINSSYIKAFACFNLAMTIKDSKIKAQFLKKAIELIPTWPKARKLLENLN